MTRTYAWGLTLLLLALFGGGAAAQTPPEAPDVEIISERLLLTRGPDGPLVLHMVRLVNVGPRVAEEVRLPVPEGARLLDVPEDLVGSVGFVIDPNPMPAGEGRQYIFSYELPWQRLPMAIRRPLFYPTALLEVWVEDGLVLRGVGMRAVAEEEIGGRRFTVYVTGELSPHPQWQVLLETETSPGASVSDRERLGQRSDPLDIVRANPLPGLLLLGALVVVVGAFVARRRQMVKQEAAWVADTAATAAAPAAETAAPASQHIGGMKDAPAVPADEASPTQEAPAAGPDTDRSDGSGRTAEIARLKELIVQLDVAYQNDELEEDLYLERRQALRNELLRKMGRRGRTEASTGSEERAGTGEESS